MRELRGGRKRLWDLPPAEIRAIVRREVAEREPELAAERGRLERAGRHVRFHALRDGMAELVLHGPPKSWPRPTCGWTTRRGWPARAGASETLDQLRHDTAARWLARWRTAARPVGPRLMINVTSWGTSLLGLDDEPATLHGPAGPQPLPAELVRRLAHDPEQATWRRILLDPATGIAVDVSPAYPPPPRMAEFVRVRDGHRSRFPTSNAARNELDHVQPFDHREPAAGGPTTRRTWPAPVGRTTTSRPTAPCRSAATPMAGSPIGRGRTGEFRSFPHQYADPHDTSPKETRRRPDEAQQASRRTRRQWPGSADLTGRSGRPGTVDAQDDAVAAVAVAHPRVARRRVDPRPRAITPVRWTPGQRGTVGAPGTSASAIRSRTSSSRTTRCARPGCAAGTRASAGCCSGRRARERLAWRWYARGRRRWTTTGDRSGRSGWTCRRTWPTAVGSVAFVAELLAATAGAAGPTGLLRPARVGDGLPPGRRRRSGTTTGRCGSARRAPTRSWSSIRSGARTSTRTGSSRRRRWAATQFRPPGRRSIELEQPGCLHATMDLYKWAYKLGPLVPGELLLDCFELARDVRELDMRASPYDLTALGYRPVRIETAAGQGRVRRRPARVRPTRGRAAGPPAGRL